MKKKLLATAATNSPLAVLIALLAACAQTPPPPPPPAPKPVVVVKPSQVIPIRQTERGVLMVMPTERVAFDSGKASLSQTDAFEFLDRVASILKDKTQANITLEGHTDSQGARAANQKLSEDRAAAIRAELTKRGVSEARMSTVGFAFDKPVAPNDNDAGRKANRRVELTILGEKVENITRDEPVGSFEEAFSRLKDMVEKGGLTPTSTTTPTPTSK